MFKDKLSLFHIRWASQNAYVCILIQLFFFYRNSLLNKIGIGKNKKLLTLSLLQVVELYISKKQLAMKQKQLIIM